MVKKIPIQEFIALSLQHPVIDVRSPAENTHAYFPGAYSLPLFSDAERKVVGTAYKQMGRQEAIKIGLGFFGGKMKGMVEEVEKMIGNRQAEISKKDKCISEINNVERKSTELKGNSIVGNCLLIYCWRGGMRSAGVAWLLDLYGFDVYTLVGGYKAYRNWVLQQLQKDYPLKIIGGYTGSGKTKLINELLRQHKAVIDLEAIASHKGSAFGGIGQPTQPSQEMFENMLAIALINVIQEHINSSIWLEDESQRIGILNIPHTFWKMMRTKPVYFIDIPFVQRLENITQEYGSIDKKNLADAILRIQKRLGPLETKTALAALEEGKIKECFSILLTYYDKLYEKGLSNRENVDSLLNKIPASSVDSISITEKLLSCATANTLSS